MAKRRLSFFRKAPEGTEGLGSEAAAPAEEGSGQQAPQPTRRPEPATAAASVPSAVKSSGDRAQRIRVAAENAAKAAEQRAMEEILALEEDLERAKEEASAQLASLESRLWEAEKRAAESQTKLQEAEKRAGEAEQKLKEAQATAGESEQTTANEDEAREAAVAERRATEIELAARTESAAEREQRFREIESKIGAVEERAKESDPGASIAELAVEAEKVAEGSDGAGEGDQALDVPGWVAESPPAASPEETEAKPPAEASEGGGLRGLFRRRPAEEAAQKAAPADAAPAPEPAKAAAEAAHVSQPEARAAPEPEPTPEEIPEGMLSLRVVTFDELRELGLSVTQSKRVLKYRDERGFNSVDELDQVPGFPRTFLAELKGRLVR
jgi:hypothetical protein